MKKAWNIHSHSATLHSTPSPSNASSAKSSTRTSLRPPIFNPYDRFTQPEFDAWIGDITSSIKRALRHDVEPEVELPSGRSSSWNTLPDLGGNLKRAQSPTFTEPREEESIFEDSFAHMVSRRAKGKARDPREGPGLGLKDQPIELLSDSEEEEVAESLVEHAILSEDSEDSDDGAWENNFKETGSGLAETRSRKGDRKRPGATVHGSASFPREDFGHEKEVVDYSDDDAPEFGEENDLQPPEDTGSFCEDDIGIDSRTERFPMQRCRGDKSGSEDESLHLSQSAAPIDVELVDPWDGPRTFAEDYYSGGDQLAPGLTPNHLIPMARSPVPTSTADLQPRPATDANVDSRPVSPSISTSSSPESRDAADVAAVNSSQDELEAEYYDHLEAGDTVHAVEATAFKGLESPEIASFKEARPARKKDLMSGSDQRHDIILVPFSDDEHTDADGEDDEVKFAAIPLGTSDLDIGDDWRTTDRHQGDNDTSDEDEEDEIQEVVPTQAANDVAALTLAQFPEVASTDNIGGPKVTIADPSTPTLAPTFQLTDPESFGDLPMSSPPSETPSPAADDAEGSQQPSMEQLFAVLSREIYEGRSRTPKPSLVAQGSGAEPTDNGAYQELEKFLSELPFGENATGIAPREDIASHEAFSVQHSEYVVEENWLEAEVLSADDSDDAHSMPPLDMPEVVGTIQQYEVEEPETDGRSTEAPEIAIQVFNEDASITATRTQLAASSPESVTTPTLEYPEFPVDAPRSEVTLESEALSAAVIIPAPIVADPSFPDPVPGDSLPASPTPVDFSFAPRLSIVPPLKASDPEPSQISTGISGLFTPAQRSGDGTPVLLEYETAEAPRTPDDESDTVLLSMSTPPADDRPPSDKSLTGGEDDGGNTGDEDLVNPTLTTPGPLSVHQLAAAVVDANAQEPNPHSVDTDDDISSTPRGGSVEPAASPLLTGDTSGASHKHSGRPDAMASGGERLHLVTDIAEGDEDADGEADPDYPQEVAAEADVAVGTKAVSDEVGNVIHNCEEILPHPENPPARSLVRTEPQAIMQSSSSHASPTLHDNSSAQGNGVPDGSAVSDVKATDEGEEATQTHKRKRSYPNPGSARITRSKSSANAGGGEKRVRTSSSKRGASKKSKLELVDASVTSADEDASEVASVSSGASAVYRLLRPSSRAGSVNSSASGDSPWASPTSSRVVPLVHSHGLLLHHHGRPVPPPLALHAAPVGPPKDLRSDHAKAKSPTSPSEPSTPSLRRSQSINSPVTRSNCRFHKISLPQGESGQRAHFVVPGCALGDGELMEDEDIKDEGLSTHEDHKRMLPSVETLDLDPYLVGVLRKLVGVDLLREQQEIFYLPGEKEKLRKRRQTDAVETLRQLRRQSRPSSGPLARDHSPQLVEDWQARSTPPPSASGSARSGSAQAASRFHSEERESELSDLSDDEEQPTKRYKRFAEPVPLENALAEGKLDGSPASLEHDAPEETEQTRSSRPTTRSKRKSLHPDAAAYKPSKDEAEDEEVVDTRRRKSGARKATKRSRTVEDASAAAPRPKKSRLGRSVSVAGAGVVDP